LETRTCEPNGMRQPHSIRRRGYQPIAQSPSRDTVERIHPGCSTGVLSSLRDFGGQLLASFMPPPQRLDQNLPARLGRPVGRYVFKSSPLNTRYAICLGSTLSIIGDSRGDLLGGDVATLEEGTYYAKTPGNDIRPFALNVWSGENHETGCVELRIYDGSSQKPGTRPYTPTDAAWLREVMRGVACKIDTMSNQELMSADAKAGLLNPTLAYVEFAKLPDAPEGSAHEHGLLAGTPPTENIPDKHRKAE